MNNDEQVSRLSRWSRRKRGEDPDGGEAETVTTPQPEADPETAAAEKAALAAEHEANRLAAEAVDIEKLEKETDMSVFFKAGVPELLKKRALMALWRTDPIFANVDGLVDYGQDFGSAKLNMKTFTSAYQIGKGYFFPEKEEPVAQDVVQAQTQESPHPLVDETDEDEDRELELAQDNLEEMEERGRADGAIPEPVTPHEVVETDAAQTIPSPRISLRKRLQMEG